MKPKIVKNNKVIKLRPTRISVKHLLRKATVDQHEFSSVVLLVEYNNGATSFGWSKGLSKKDILAILELELFKLKRQITEEYL